MGDVGSAQRRVLAELWRREGEAWREALGEIHDAYGQAPFFILLAEGASPLEAHREFWRILEPELDGFGDVSPTVSYKALAGEGVLWLGFFEGEAEMRRALDPAGWSAPVRQELAAATLFRRVRDLLRPPATKPRGRKRR